MSEVVERVARAFCQPPDMWDRLPKSTKQTFFYGPARAAIVALREPTPDMVTAGENDPNDSHSRYVWQRMIDQALTEEPLDEQPTTGYSKK